MASCFEKRILSVKGNNLEGKVQQSWKGESKEWLLSQLHDIKKEKQEDALKEFLAKGKSNYQINNLKIININDYNSDLKIEYDLVYKDAVSSFGKESYIDIDDRKDLARMKFDTAKRKLPFMFPYKGDMIYEVELQIPADSKPSVLPASLKIEQADYSMNGTYLADKSKITYKREIMIKKALVPKQNFLKWNADIDKLNEFYNNQLSITK